jgi:hypothetical protein
MVFQILKFLILSAVCMACQPKASDDTRIALAPGEGTALVASGAAFADWLAQQEAQARAFLESETVASRGSGDNEGQRGGIEEYEITVWRAGENLHVTFVPTAAESEFLRDGTIEYVLRPGALPERVVAAGAE